MQNFARYWFILLLIPFTSVAQSPTRAAVKPNVLFICVDDLRPDLGCYGEKYVSSPNIDRLAENGVVFTNQFVAVPTCGASRFSMLTGMLPRTKGHLSNNAIRTFLSDQAEVTAPETFIHHLRRNGYYTVGVGKISHYADGLVYGYTEPVTSKLELPHSWDEMVFNPGKWGTGWNAFFGYADGTNRQGRSNQVPPFENAVVGDEGYPDGLTAELAVGKLKELSKKDKPFFLGVGFFKPHLPFNAPAEYTEPYRDSNIPLTPSPDIPQGINRASLHASSEFNRYKLGEEIASLDSPVSDAYQLSVRKAYLAAISYVDAQVGKVLDALEEEGLADNTIVVLWGDHGWHLGDHRVWGKHTLFERSLKSVLIMRVPGRSDDGKRIDRIVNSVDIYPTLVELCGVEMNFQVDGNSLTPLLDRPRTSSWKDQAWGFYNSGITLRTPRYRIARYFRNEEPVVELYDHKNDPWENRNVAPENPRVVRKLLPLLDARASGMYGQ